MIEILLSRRFVAALLLLGAGVHLGAVAAGMRPAACPLQATTGLPCPGCGLSRAGLHMVQGHLALMWRLHPFAPYFALVGLMLAGGAILPDWLRTHWRNRWVAVEQRTRIHAVALTAFVLYGALRLLWSTVSPW